MRISVTKPQIAQIYTRKLHRKDAEDAEKNKNIYVCLKLIPQHQYLNHRAHRGRREKQQKIYVCLKLLPSPPKLRGTTNSTNNTNIFYQFAGESSPFEINVALGFIPNNPMAGDEPPRYSVFFVHCLKSTPMTV